MSNAELKRQAPDRGAIVRVRRFFRRLVLGPYREIRRPAFSIDLELDRRRCMARETLVAARKNVDRKPISQFELPNLGVAFSNADKDLAKTI